MLNQPIKKCNHTETCIFQNSVVYSVIINVCREESLGSLGQPAPARAIAWTRQCTGSSWHFPTPGPRIPTLPSCTQQSREGGNWIANQLALAISWAFFLLSPLLPPWPPTLSPPPLSQARADSGLWVSPSPPPPPLLLLHINSFSHE